MWEAGVQGLHHGWRVRGHPEPVGAGLLEAAPQLGVLRWAPIPGKQKPRNLETLPETLTPSFFSPALGDRPCKALLSSSWLVAEGDAQALQWAVQGTPASFSCGGYAGPKHSKVLQNLPPRGSAPAAWGSCAPTAQSPSSPPAYTARTACGAGGGGRAGREFLRRRGGRRGRDRQPAAARGAGAGAGAGQQGGTVTLHYRFAQIETHPTAPPPVHAGLVSVVH